MKQILPNLAWSVFCVILCAQLSAADQPRSSGRFMERLLSSEPYVPETPAPNSQEPTPEVQPPQVDKPVNLPVAPKAVESTTLVPQPQMKPLPAAEPRQASSANAPQSVNAEPPAQMPATSTEATDTTPPAVKPLSTGVIAIIGILIVILLGGGVLVVKTLTSPKKAARKANEADVEDEDSEADAAVVELPLGRTPRGSGMDDDSGGVAPILLQATPTVAPRFQPSAQPRGGEAGSGAGPQAVGFPRAAMDQFLEAMDRRFQASLKEALDVQKLRYEEILEQQRMIYENAQRALPAPDSSAASLDELSRQVANLARTVESSNRPGSGGATDGTELVEATNGESAVTNR